MNIPNRPNETAPAGISSSIRESVERLDADGFRDAAERHRIDTGELLPGVEYSERGDSFSLSFSSAVKPKRATPEGRKACCRVQTAPHGSPWGRSANERNAEIAAVKIRPSVTPAWLNYTLDLTGFCSAAGHRVHTGELHH